MPLPVSIKNEAINSLVFGIADGVGGMAEYGGNETAFMSHELMRLCGEAIKTTTTSAKIILQTAWDALIKEGMYMILYLIYIYLFTYSPNRSYQTWINHCSSNTNKTFNY